MRNSGALRKFILPTLSSYRDVRELAAAVAQLVEDEEGISSVPQRETRCRVCNKVGHLARNCPRNRPTPPARRPIAPVAEAEWD